jgi:hypothetical protein
MAYKFTTGSVRRGDVYYEDDRTGEATYIDFGQDTRTLRPSGSQILHAIPSAVGVGTINPTQNLHVVGPGNTTLRVQGSDGYYGAINVKGGTGDSAWVWQPANTSELRFFTVDDDRMVILGTGEIGVGTNTPKTAIDIHHNPTALSNNTGGGEVVTFGTGNLTAAKVYYLSSAGAWTETDANAIGTSDGLLAIALGTAPSDGLLLRGFFDAATYLTGFTSGASVYLSDTAASLVITPPTGTDVIVRCVGYCTNTANVIYFNPGATTIELL